jgi:glucose-1-phosphate thymidylyltransferase
MKNKKTVGIILAGGYGTRLYPLTSSFSKHLFQIYDKPMIYYSLSILFLAKIKDILIICTSRDHSFYKNLFNDGQDFGVNIKYLIQDDPKGIVHALSLSKNFCNNSNICTILGDNFFHSDNLTSLLTNSKKRSGASIFCYQVDNPSQYGILEIKNSKIKITEKPSKSSSNLAITGLYFFDNNIFKYIDQIKPSKRGEYEITDLINLYLNQDNLHYEVLGRGATWYDSGTIDDMLSVSNYVKLLQNRQNNIIACLEEISLNNNWISKFHLKKKFIKIKNNCNYSKYIWNLVS